MSKKSTRSSFLRAATVQPAKVPNLRNDALQSNQKYANICSTVFTELWLLNTNISIRSAKLYISFKTSISQNEPVFCNALTMHVKENSNTYSGRFLSNTLAAKSLLKILL